MVDADYGSGLLAVTQTTSHWNFTLRKIRHFSGGAVETDLDSAKFMLSAAPLPADGYPMELDRLFFWREDFGWSCWAKPPVNFSEPLEKDSEEDEDACRHRARRNISRL